MTELIRVSEYQRVFREAAMPNVELDRNDVRRTIDLVSRKLYDLLLAAQASAKQDDRDVMQYADLPVTDGLREQIDTFSRMGANLEPGPIYQHLGSLWPLEFDYADDLERALPDLIGGLVVAVARTMRALDTRELENPDTEAWDRTERLLNIVL